MPGPAASTAHFLAAAFLGVMLTGCSVYDDSLLEPAEANGNSGSVGGGGGSGGTTDAVTSTGTGGGATSSTGRSGGSDSGGTGPGGGGSSSIGESSTMSSTSGGSGGSGGVGGVPGGTGGGGAGGTTSSSSGSTITGGTDCSDDCCPDNPDKTEPGACGCDVAETDTDDDGTPDCVDLCPDDPDKTEAGECGCGVRDNDTAAGAGCLTLKNGLVHRYSFDSTGNTASDTAGSADATIVGTALDGSGTLELSDGGSEQYAELPAGVLSELTNTTIEAWFIWNGMSSWERLFDFGSSDQGPGERGNGVTYLFFATKAAGTSSTNPRAIFTDNGFASEIICTGSASLQTGKVYHVAVSLDTVNDTMTLYVDGMLQSAKAFSGTLASLDDVNNWLGRSQYAVDPQFVGSIDEFRIYDVALTNPQVAFSFASGPAPAFLED